MLLYHHLFIFSKIYGHLGSFVIVPHYNIVNNLVHVFCETDLHMSFGHVTTALSAAERSYPTSEVRGRSREDPMPEGRRPRGLTPRPRSGAAAESARLQRRRKGREELPKSEVRGSREELPHAPGRTKLVEVMEFQLSYFKS